MTTGPTRFLLAITAILAAACSGPSGPGDQEEPDAPMQQGRAIYLANCAACHGPTGDGLPGAFPPLAGSDYLRDNREAAIKGIINGQQGPIVVNGQTYNGVMPGFGHLSDDAIAAVTNYILSSWGNDLGQVSAEEIAALRSE